MLSDYYLWIKLAHILGAVVLMGTGCGIAFFMYMASRSNNVQAIAVTTKHVVLADWWFTAPAICIQYVSGILLVKVLGYSHGAMWFHTVSAIFIAIGLLWIPVVKIQYKLRAEAQLSIEQGQLTDKFHHLMKRWFWLGVAAFALMLVMFYLMIFKPLAVY